MMFLRYVSMQKKGNTWPMGLTSLSRLASSADESLGSPLRHLRMPGGQAVLGPQPLCLSMRSWKSRDSWVNTPCRRMSSSSCSGVHFQSSGGSKVAKFSRNTGLFFEVMYHSSIAVTTMVFRARPRASLRFTSNIWVSLKYRAYSTMHAQTYHFICDLS
jgi:hypothetical protein